MAHIECRRPEGEELLGDCVTREYPNHRRRINAQHRSITRGADEVLQSRVDFFSTLSAQRLSVAIQTLKHICRYEKGRLLELGTVREQYFAILLAGTYVRPTERRGARKARANLRISSNSQKVGVMRIMFIRRGRGLHSVL